MLVHLEIQEKEGHQGYQDLQVLQELSACKMATCCVPVLVHLAVQDMLA